MKIHRVELEHVRHIERVELDFSHPLTILGGRNGIGKTTVQEAILTAMFERKKEERESLLSRFDPDSPPIATLDLSRGGDVPTIRLRRTLTDKSGQWIEGPSHIKAKGEALRKIQESLPISAEAAALLLWGRQNDLAAVVRDFPSDGHSLLTAATIKGAGPDPKQAIEDLEGQIKDAKRGGQRPGPLTRAQDRLKTLETELHDARESFLALEKLQRQYTEARDNRDGSARERQQAEQEVRRLDGLQSLLETALTTQEEADRLDKQLREWDGLDDEINRRGKIVASLAEEIEQLHSQYRVALDKDLASQYDRLLVRVRLAEEADARCRQLKQELHARSRPDERELKLLGQHQSQHSESLGRLDATGLRYEISVASGAGTVEISEDGAPMREVTFAAGRTHEGIVGSVAIRAGDVHLVARGKEDVSSLKRAADRTAREIAALLARFQAADEEAFRRLAEERSRIVASQAEANADLKKHLRDDSLESLKAEVESLQNRRQANPVTPEDQAAWGATILPAVAQIERSVAAKQAEHKSELKNLKQVEGRRPTESQQQQLRAAVRQSQGAAQSACEAFFEESSGARAPSKELREAIRVELHKMRTRLDELRDKETAADKLLERLSVELKHAGPKRSIGGIEADLDDARAGLHREEVLQKARELLKSRIGEKIQEMSEGVPRELAARIGRNLSQLTGGVYAKVSLNEAFSIDKIGEGGERPEHWQPHELSVGEQALTALVMKIAVARALAESGTPVFVLLDDSLVNLDPQYRTATESLLLDLIADGRLQVILLTCHTDWAEDWQRRCPEQVQYVDLASRAKYYRTPPALAAGPCV